MDNEDVFEELLVALEGAANMMRGIVFDPRVPADTKEALLCKARAIDNLIEKYS